MAKNPKNPPPNNEPPGSGGDDSLPPWLRGDAPPPPEPPKQQPSNKSSIPRLSPRKGDEPDESVPPWLRGLDAPESKNVKIGNQEVPREFFDDADTLADAFESDQSYDDWLADQNESKREKSVEEEIPDMFAGLSAPESQTPSSAATPASSTAYPTPDSPGTTGQLPDWFLGLEELDDSEAPDWFKQMGTGPLAAEPPKKPEPKKEDPIVDFFQNLGMEVEEENDDDSLNLPGTGFFHNLVGKEAPSESPRRTAPPSSFSDDDDEVPDFGSVTGNAPSPTGFQEDDPVAFDPFGALSGGYDFEEESPRPIIGGGQTMRLDIDDEDAPPRPMVGGQTIRFDEPEYDMPTGGQTIRFDKEESVVPTDELNAFMAGLDDDEPPVARSKSPAQIDVPQNELDAFLSGIDTPQRSTQEMAAIDDPDLDFFIQAEELPEPELTIEPEETVLPEITDNDLNWLNELDDIVAAASRSGDPNAEEDYRTSGSQAMQDSTGFENTDFGTMDTFNEDAPTLPRSAAMSNDFDWGDFDQTPAAPAIEEEEPEAEESNDWLSGLGEADADAPYEASTTRIPSADELGLTGLLSRNKKKEPLTPEEYQSVRQPPAAPKQPETPSAANDDFDLSSLYAENEQAGGDSSWQIPDSLSPDAPLNFGDESSDSDELSDWERVVRGGSPAGYGQASAAANDDDPFANFTNDDPVEDELNSGWLTDNVLEDDNGFGQDDFNLFDLSDSPTQSSPPSANDSDSNFLDLASTPLEIVPESEDDFFTLLERNQGANVLPLTGGLTGTASDAELENESDTLNFDELDAENAAQQAIIDNDLFSFFDEEDEESSSAPVVTTPTSSATPYQSENEPDTIDFSKWDASAEPAAASGGIDFGKWDMPAEQSNEADTIDFGKWDAEPAAASDAIDFGKWDMPAEQSNEVDTIDFGKWDAPAEPAAAADAIDFGKWDMPGDDDADLDDLFSTSNAAEAENEPDLLNFGDPDLPRESQAGTGGLGFSTWHTPNANENESDTLNFDELGLAGEPQAGLGSIDFGKWDAPPSAAEIENESDTLNFDELDYSGGAQAGVSGIDFGKWDSLAEDSAAESSAIDFGKWDDTPTTDEDDLDALFATPSTAKVENEADTINFDDLDLTGDEQSGASSIDFGKWDMPGTDDLDALFASPSPAEHENEIDTINFDQLNTNPQEMSWDMPATGDLEKLFPAPSEAEIENEADTLNFDEFSTNAAQAGAGGIDFGKWDMPGDDDLDALFGTPGENEPQAEADAIDFGKWDSPAGDSAAESAAAADAIDFGKWDMPGTGELGDLDALFATPSGSEGAYDSGTPNYDDLDRAYENGTVEDKSTDLEEPDFFSFLGESEEPKLPTPPTPQRPMNRSESETIDFDDLGLPQMSGDRESDADADDLDPFAFLGETETPPVPPVPPVVPATPPAGMQFRSSDSDTIEFGDLEFPPDDLQPSAQAYDDEPSIFDTIITREAHETPLPPAPERDAENVEEAAADNFFESFGLDDDSKPRSTLEEFEVEDIFASLDSEPLIEEDDTQPQLTFELADAPSATVNNEAELDALFATWEDSQPEDEAEEAVASLEDDEDLEADDLFASWDQARAPEPEAQGNPDAVEPFDLFGDWGTEDIAPIVTPEDPLEGWDSDTPPPLAVPETYTQKRATSSLPAIVPPEEEDPDLFAEWGMGQAEPSNESDVNVGINWAQEFGAQQTDPEGFKAGRDKSDSKPSLPAFEDIDTYLSSLGTDQPQISQQTGSMFDRPDNMDIDALLDQQVGGERESRRAGYVSPFAGDTEGLESANVDFLNQLSAGVEDVSAGAMVRQKQDRPVEELPERLRKLRERSAKMQQAQQSEEYMSDDSLSEVLPGVDVGLAQANFGASSSTALDRSLNLSSDQQSRVNLLQSLVGAVSAERPRMSAIEMTYDTPFMEDFQDDDENVVHPPSTTQETDVSAVAKPRTRRRFRIRVQPDRLVIAFLLAVGVIAPFLVPALRFGDPPPADFSNDAPAAAAFTAVDSLGRNDLVLVAVEYAPSASGELDTMTDSILRHVLLRGASPVVVGSNAVSLMRAEGFLNDVNDDADFLTRIDARQPLEQNYEYFVTRFLTGGVIGLRAFSSDTANLLASDIRGQTTNLYINGLQDFALVVVITDNGETLRGYAEQIAPLTDAPLIAASTYGAAPLVEPYTRSSSSVAGLLSGYADALTYAGLLDGVEAVERGPRRIVTPPPIREPVQPETQSGTGGTAGGAEATAEAEAESTAEAGSSGTSGTSGTTPELPLARVNADQRVNMRSGPSSTASVITGVDPGTEVTLIGGDGQWANVRLPDGREGWISITLLSIEPTNPSRKVRPQVEPVKQEPDVPMTNTRAATRTPSQATATPEPSETPTRTPTEASATQEADATADATSTPRPSRTPSPTPEPTETPTEEATEEVVLPPPTPTPLVFSAGLQSERWYGINMGIIVSVLVISTGAFVNILRSLFRGRRNR